MSNWAESYPSVIELYQTADHPALSPKIRHLQWRVLWRLFFPTNRSVQCRREAQAQCGGQGQQHTLWLQVESSTSSGRSTGEHKQGLGEVSCCGLCRAKTVRICFHTCANILSTPIFCQRQFFVEANILLMPIFCWRQYCVDTTMFCRCQYFVGANVLSAPIFCLCLDFQDD